MKKIFAATGIAGMLAGAFMLTAGSADAHQKRDALTCSEASVHLTNYNPKVKNYITIVLDGVGFTEFFDSNYTFSQPLDPAKNHTMNLGVLAGDDLNSKKGFSFQDSLATTDCVPVVESSSPPVETSTPPVESSSPPVETSTPPVESSTPVSTPPVATSSNPILIPVPSTSGPAGHVVPPLRHSPSPVHHPVLHPVTRAPRLSSAPVIPAVGKTTPIQTVALANTGAATTDLIIVAIVVILVGSVMVFWSIVDSKMGESLIERYRNRKGKHTVGFGQTNSLGGN